MNLKLKLHLHLEKNKQTISSFPLSLVGKPHIR